jgi:FkbM family methyltransferase
MRFISYSQNFEDVMLRRALHKIENGFYIDVGAGHPVEMSVTKTFYDAGWNGINIEPASHYFDLLQAARPRDVNLKLAAAERHGSHIFYGIVETGLSTLDPDIAAGHEAAGWSVQTETVEIRRLADICHHYAPAEIHFLKIDVEGAEGAVLSGADFQNFRPWIVLLEATRPLTNIVSDDWETIILAADYIFVWFDGLNRFYVSKERYDELQPHFVLPPNSFDMFVIYDAELSTCNQALSRQLSDAKQTLKDNENSILLLEAETLLRRKMEVSAAYEVELQQDRAARDYASLRAENAKLHADASIQREIITTLRAEIRIFEDSIGAKARTLERVISTLEWPDGPRALRTTLPLARMIREVSRIRLVRKIFRPLLVLTRIIRISLRKAPVPNLDSGPTSIRASQNIPEELIDEKTTADLSPGTPEIIRSKPPCYVVHQFHPGCTYGDAVTNSMILTRGILRGLGYRSEIYVVSRDPLLSDEVMLVDDLPLHDEYVLIVLHSLGYDDAARIMALPAAKILMYHNITPAHMLSEVPELARLADLGRDQLDLWRDHVAATLAVSEFNALELRKHGYRGVAICPLLFDIESLRSRADAATPRNPEDPFTVLFVGRILESKGQAELVDAFAAFNLVYGSNCRLVLVGRTEGGADQYLAKLYQRIGDQGLRRCVFLTGHVSDSELSDWFKTADLYVSLSQHEGFGVPLIEAMSFGVPVLAYGAGAVPFTMQETGNSQQTLYSRDAKTVATRMLEIASDASLRVKIITEQYENLDRFALSHYIPTLERALAAAGIFPPSWKSASLLADKLVFTVAGHFNGSYSLAAANRALATALSQARPGLVNILPVEGRPTSTLDDVPTSQRHFLQSLASVTFPDHAPSVVISQHYPVYLPAPADLRIAYFFWEESLIPKETISVLNSNFQAVFSPSYFVTKALIDSGVKLPVCTVGYAPDLSNYVALGEHRVTRKPGKKLTFLHVSSAYPRKGLDILLAAYSEAFTSRDTVRLVIKTISNPHNEADKLIERVRTQNDDLAEIELIEQDIADTDLLALYKDADIAVLPTRGEGFNVPAAEALASGLALIVTGGGGQADFVSSQNASLVPWTFQPSRSHLKSGQSLWLEPDQDALVRAMREVALDMASPDSETVARTTRARKAIVKSLDPAKWAESAISAAAYLMHKPPPRAKRLTVISSWNVRCGIAEYTKSLIFAITGTSDFSDTLLLLCDDRTPPSETPGIRVRPAWSLGAADTAALWLAINQEDPHAIIIQHHPGLISWPSLASLLGSPRLARCVVVVTLHSTLELLRIPEKERDVVIASLKLCDRVIVHTIADINFLHGLDVVENVVVIPQGVTMPDDSHETRRISGDIAPVIGCYGFLLPPKGIDLLIAAIPEIRKVHRNLQVRLVNSNYGTDESTEEFETCSALAIRLGVDDCIEWITEFLPHQESVRLLQSCDLIVLPYRATRESSSAALRSCMSSGVPIIVAPNLIFAEAANAVARLPGHTPDEIAHGVNQLLSDWTAREALKSETRLWAAERSWGDIACRTYGMLNGLMENRLFDEMIAPSA